MESTVKDLIKHFSEKNISTKQHEIVSHSVKHLAFLYGKKNSLEEIREITERGIKQSGESLSLAVKKMREESL